MSGTKVGQVSIRDIAAGRLPEILRLQLGQKLIEAAKDGNVEMVRKPLNMQGVDVNAANSGGDTALILAAAHGNVEVVKELLGNEKVDKNSNFSVFQEKD